MKIVGTWEYTPLQWGRVGEDAEVDDITNVYQVMFELQWGRVGEDAEVGDVRFEPRPDCVLQWGRVGEDAEVPLGKGERRWRRNASMGPRR